MKTTIENEVEQTESKYPCLKKSPNNTIVLFTQKNRGVCLISGNPGNTPGEYFEGWNEERFVLLDPCEIVKLQNEA